MAHKITLYNNSSLCLYTKKTIKFCDNIEFTVAPIKNSDESYYFQIENIKGDLEITAVKNSHSFDYPRYIDVEYNCDSKTFHHQIGTTPYYSFDIVANVNFKKVYAAIYRLQIPYSQLQCLKLFEYFEDEIILPGIDNLKFTYSVTRTMLNHIGEGIEVCIKNPLNARIQGKTGDYKFEMRIGDIKCEISFVVESIPSNASNENEKNSVDFSNIVPENEPSKLTSNSVEKPLARMITVAETVTPTQNVSGSYNFKVEDVKGDFEITNITCSNGYGSTRVPYHRNTKTFHYAGSLNHTFTIVANVPLKAVKVEVYRLHIPQSKVLYLGIHEFFQDEIYLPGYDNLKFTYYVRKVVKEDCKILIEVQIKNPYNVKIEGFKGDFLMQQALGSIDHEISFIFKQTSSNDSTENEPDSKTSNDSSHTENKPSKLLSDSAEKGLARKITVAETGDLDIPTKKKSRINSNSKWYEIMSNQQYSDVTLISSDNIEIPSHRCILAKYSPVFEKIIAESTELPVKINVENFDAETIQAALGFLFDKIDSINGKEMDVFKFADRYVIKDIMDACCSFFEESVDPSNVCEYIQIAYIQKIVKN